MKVTFEEAFQIMMNFHKVMHDVDKEICQLNESVSLSGDTSRSLFMIHFLKIKTLKEMKDHINSKHQTHDEKLKRLMEVKISKNVKELMDKGFLETKSSAEDARVKEIFITEKGQEYIDSFLSRVRVKWEEIN